MRVAAIYDIHGNLPALEAVLDEIRDEEVDEIVVGGDIVPGPMPRDCVSALQDLSLPVRFIRGNGENDVLAVHRGEVEFCHATPRDDNEIFTRVTPERRLRPIFEATGAALLICGHTHMQFDRRVGEVRVVNAGSVGMPFGEPGAYWALLGPGGVELRHTTYDLEAADAHIRSTEYPSELEVQRPPSESEMLDVFEAAALR
jgi:putative phosphoesterase